MGTLHYAGTRFDLGDVALAHLAAVISAKLRRHEPFMLAVQGDEGKELVWLHPSSDLRLRHAHDGPLDMGRIETMMRHAATTAGLDLTGVLGADLPAAPGGSIGRRR